MRDETVPFTLINRIFLLRIQCLAKYATSLSFGVYHLDVASVRALCMYCICSVSFVLPLLWLAVCALRVSERAYTCVCVSYIRAYIVIVGACSVFTSSYCLGAM